MISRATIRIGEEVFTARLRHDLAPRSCARLCELAPYVGKIVHARWSGEACWSPLADIWAAGSGLVPENATSHPLPGEVLLFAGGISEPELLFPYGASQFASKAGPLAGNPVISIDPPLDRLTNIGRQILWHGAAELRISFSEMDLDTSATQAPDKLLPHPTSLSGESSNS